MKLYFKLSTIFVILAFLITYFLPTPGERYAKAMAKREPLIYALRGASVKLLGQAGGGGSGFAVTMPSGNTKFMTNAHVCEQGAGMTVMINEVALGFAKKVKQDYSMDLCLLEYSVKTDAVAYFGTKVYTTGQVWSLGFPMLHEQVITEGWALRRRPSPISIPDVSKEQCDKAKGTMINAWTGYGFTLICTITQDVVFTTMRVYPGSSGSPVFNTDGYVIGVVQSYDRETNNGQYVPLDLIQEFVKGE